MRQRTYDHHWADMRRVCERMASQGASLWRCPECRREERAEGAPSCSGATKDARHPETTMVLVEYGLVALSRMPSVAGDGFPTASMGGGDSRHVGGGDPGGETAARRVDVELHPDARRDARYVGPDDTRVAASDDDEPTGRSFEADLVAEWLKEIFATTAEARGMLLRIAALERAIARRRRRGDRQPTGGDCLACDRFVSGSASDRLRSGLCSACAQAWYRFRSAAAERGEWADPVAFRAQRRRASGLSP